MFSNVIVKHVIIILALVNIIAMVVFQYGLPPQSASSGSKVDAENNTTEETAVGTIESVEQEAAAREAEAVENALAREESGDAELPAEEDVPADPNAPILELTENHVYLKVGERFNYMSYIKTMEDVDGSDLSRYIYLDKDVDTSSPGEIELTYRITSAITGKSDSEVLLITITE